MIQDEKEGLTRQYWSHMDLAKGLHLSRGHLYRLLDQGQMLGPDIVIAADRFGWDPRRAQRFGVDADRLDSDFRPIGPPPDGSLAKAETLAKTRYSVTPRVYLSSWLCSYVYGLKKNAVYFMRQRKAFIPADVKIEPKTYGWSEERVIEFGEQTGRLDDAKIDEWVRRRTAEFGLSPDIEWVRRRMAARPALYRTVEEALEKWRMHQEANAEAAEAAAADKRRKERP
jgi:predicted DNA-binding transcriptional regulator AlpA